MIHKSVLLEEVLHFLNPQLSQNFIDATMGEGGHTRAILERTAPNGIVLGIDKDVQQIERAKKELLEFKERLIYVNDSFARVRSIVSKENKAKEYIWHGIIFDLGWSQAQVDLAGRGFSFLRDEPLDMRYGVKLKVNPPAGGLKLKVFTAGEIVNKRSKGDIEYILKEYGGERFAIRIVNAILSARKQKQITTTFQLVDIIKKATPFWYHHRRIHPATRTFQALRIVTNNEYEELEHGIEGALSVLSTSGRIAVISFHSGEDRIVKTMFRKFEKDEKGKIITKKPVVPSWDETVKNPRARSAKLRVFQKV